MSKHKLLTAAILCLIILFSNLAAECSEGPQKFTVKIEPSEPSHAWETRSWDGKIELYHSYDRFDDATTEVLTISGSSSKTYEVRAKGVCVRVYPTTPNDAAVWAYIDYKGGWGPGTFSDISGSGPYSTFGECFLDPAQVCAYCDSWPDG